MVRPRSTGRLVIYSLGAVAFACSVAAEFKKTKAKDMRLDGSLCSLPRSPAYALGITALVCLSIAQIVGASKVGCRRLCPTEKKAAARNRIASITLLILSWVSFAVAAILLATGSSMSGEQPYGKGWMDGDCYIVADGVFGGAAVLVVTTIAFVLGFALTTTAGIHQQTTTVQMK